MAWSKTMFLTVYCPYCGDFYTFRKRETKEKWVAAGKVEPLHRACKMAYKHEEHDV